MNPASDAVVGALTGLAIAAVIGLAIGAFARLLPVDRQRPGWGASPLLGMAGAWIGGFLFGALDMGRTLPGQAGAALGAALLLAACQQLRRGRRPHDGAAAPARRLEHPARVAR